MVRKFFFRKIHGLGLLLYLSNFGTCFVFVMKKLRKYLKFEWMVS
jgi:hypothetical protein